MDAREIEDMKEYMLTLQEVKVSLGKIEEKMNQLTDIRLDLKEIATCARDADTRSQNNQKDIDDLTRKTDDIINNDRKKWGAILTVGGAFILQLIYFLMTYHVK
jgi:conjugal transfer/entry exclusion protein